MSWLDNAQNNLTIETGDGKTYTPLYMIAPKEYEFWLSRFAFINIAGELVKRREVKATQLELEIYFQGDDHLDTAEAFEASSLDQRAWTISHPMYGELIMQPSKIRRDSSGYNLTRFDISLLETIQDDAPRVGVDPQEQAKLDFNNYQETGAESFSNRVDAEVSDTNLLTENAEALYAAAENVAEDAEEAQDYVNAYNTALTSILSYTAEPLAAMREIRAFIAAPSLFSIQVKNRISLLQDQLNDLITSIVNLGTVNKKIIFEDNAGALVGGMVQAALNPLEDDYQNTTDVLEVITTLLEGYNAYIEALETLQSDNGASSSSYIPDYNTIAGLENVVNYTVSELFNIALNAKQERELVLEADSNVLILTHRLIGLDPAGDNVQEFMNNNNIGPSEILQLKKDRIVVYYV